MTGQITTFYSYKGGTGRSMALANVAWILAANGKRVLVVDWDVEAPGLHRYFLPFLDDVNLHRTEGLIELLTRYVSLMVTPKGQRPPLTGEPLSLAEPQRYAVPMSFDFPRDGCLHLLGAGRQDHKYVERVRAFDWSAFYERFGGTAFIDMFAEKARRQYDHVLIDSRTGISDTAGICTVQLPSQLILCFTYNRQSVEGVSAVAESVARLKPNIQIYPVAMRVVKGAVGLDDAREFARTRMSRFLDVRMDENQREDYWVNAEVPHYPVYGFEETLAPFVETVGGRNNLLADMEWLAGRLCGDKVPTPRQPRMSEAIRERYLRRFRFRDPRSAWLQETLELEPARALAAIREEAVKVRAGQGDIVWLKTLCSSLRSVAEKLLREGQLSLADAALQETLSLARLINDVEEEARSAHLLANLLATRGHVEEALNTIRAQVLPLYERIGDFHARAVAMGQIADILTSRGDLDGALRILEKEQLPVFERLGDERGRAVTMGQIADILESRGDLDGALRILEKEQLPVFELIGDARAHAVTMGKIAGILEKRGDIDGAARILTRHLLPAYERLGDVHSRAVTMGQMARLLQKRGDLDGALRLLRDDLLPVFEGLGDVHARAVAMGQVADILKKRGDLDGALRILEKELLPAFERFGDTRGRAVTMGKIADILEARGALKEALQIRQEEQLPIFERLGEQELRAATMDRIVKLLATLDEPIKPRTASEGAKIFINYRRDDSAYQARRVYDALQRAIPKDNLYMDIESIPPGADFVDVLEGWVRQCDVFLALIGPGWMRTNDPDTGQRRLDDPNDFVRIEIRAALSRGIPVVPVLLEGASLPPESELPNDIKPLARRNAVRVGQQSFESDIARLARGLGLT